MNNEKAVSVLNDLLKITSDRIEGFTKSSRKIQDQLRNIKYYYRKFENLEAIK